MEATAANPLSTSPPLTVDRVDKMYRQLAEIHAIAATQLAECARWQWSDPTTSPVRAGADRLRPTMMPSTTRMAPSPLLISCPKPPYGGRVSASSPRLTASPTRVAWVHCPSATHRANARVDLAISLGTCSRSRAASPPSAPPAMRRACFVLP
jgi:hypothetical protein